MKKTILVFCAIFLLWGASSFAGTYYVQVVNNAFIPSNLNVNAGDQIIWTLMAGTHTTTSTAVPLGAATWNYQFTGVGDTYTYNVTVGGQYAYHCIYHALMTATFTAADNFPLVENFDYPAGDSLRLYGWNITGTVFSNPELVVSPGLSYPNYPLSGIGNAAGLGNTGADVNKQFPDSVNTGSVYAAAMVNITTGQTGDYFMHFGVSPTNSSIFMGRVFVKLAANGNLAFGISKSSISASIVPNYTDSIYTTGTTYLLVLKYKFNAGVNDDSVFLFVNPAITPTEPAASVSHGTSSANDPTSLGTINIRQGTAASAPTLVIDGIKVSLSWAQVVPVELTSFTANASGNNVTLRWTTASETNNRGFEIQKLQSGTWTTSGFVQGKGTSTEENSYSFTDKDLQSGKYIYRLKQVDFDGSYSYSQNVEVTVSAPLTFELSQNYPNPFNPSTTIHYAIPEAGNVKLIVYNLLGQEVKSLVNGFKEAGAYSVNFDASGLNSGLYLYKLETGSYTQVKKMTLLK